MKYTKISLLVILFISLAACVTYAPFTEPMLQSYKLDNKNIRTVQFYISDEILMFKLQEEQSKGKQGTTFVRTDGGVSEKIRIKRLTPCIVETIDKEGNFYVRFEAGKDKVLKFRRADNNRFYLLTEQANNRYQVEYGGDLYYVNTPSLVSFLSVRMQNSRDTTLQRRIDGKRAM